MVFQESERALNLMRCALPEQRRSLRVQLTIRAEVIFPAHDAEPQTALLRDINIFGAFFYCSRTPVVGELVLLNFVLASHGHSSGVRCEGIVVRVEGHAPGAAIGVALQFTKYEIVGPQAVQLKTEQSSSSVDWSAQMVEEMFARGPQLETWAWRVQGTA